MYRGAKSVVFETLILWAEQQLSYNFITTFMKLLGITFGSTKSNL